MYFSLNVSEQKLSIGGKLDVIGSEINFKDWHTDFQFSVSVFDAFADVILQLGVSETKFLNMNFGGNFAFLY